MKSGDLLPAVEYDLTCKQAEVLFMVANGNRTPTRIIAVMLKISRPSVTRSFDKLCQVKLIKRERSQKDGRDVFGVLTGKGKKLMEKMK
jgi:DNA-binding MarR family transcriptional regulator